MTHTERKLLCLVSRLLAALIEECGESPHGRKAIGNLQRLVGQVQRQACVTNGAGVPGGKPCAFVEALRANGASESTNGGM